MLKSVLFRLLRILLTSVLCSAPIYLQYILIIPDGVILFIAFIAFIIATGIDTYRFSSIFWKKRDYLLGHLLPMGIYCFSGMLTRLLFPPIVFNRIFLPLRALGCMDVSTGKSIVAVTVFLVLFITGMSFCGSMAGRSNNKMFMRED